MAEKVRLEASRVERLSLREFVSLLDHGIEEIPRLVKLALTSPR